MTRLTYGGLAPVGRLSAPLVALLALLVGALGVAVAPTTALAAVTAPALAATAPALAATTPALAATAPALAATAPAPVTAVLSGVTVGAGDIRGVVTVRSAANVQVDAASVSAQVDGLDVPASITPIGGLTRRTMLVIDTSGSMGAAGMATVRAAVGSFLARAPRDVAIGVVSFATTSTVVLPPTGDRAAVQRAVNAFTPHGGTSLYRAVHDGVTTLGADGERSIVLLSDGDDTSAQATPAGLAAATSAVKASGARVEVIRFRTQEKGAAAALRAIASAGGGSVVAAEDTASVTRAFDAAARALDSQVRFVVQTDLDRSVAHAVSISGRAGGRAFTARYEVPLVPGATHATPSATPSSPPVAAATAAAPTFGRPQLLLWGATAAVFLGGLLLAWLLLAPFLQSRRSSRLASIEQFVGESVRHRDPVAASTSAVSAMSAGLSRVGDRVMAGRTSGRNTLALIRRADLPLRPGEWWALCAITVVTAAGLGLVLVRQSPLVGALIGASIGFVSPQLILRGLANRRSVAFERALPDLLIIVSTSLASGFSLPQALTAAAQDAPWPVKDEFSRALAESRIGVDISDALDHVAQRMGSEALEWAVMAMRIQREVGGSLADTLNTTARTLRERESLRQQMRTLSAESRLSAYILIALPIALLFYMMAVNYAYVSLLWTTTLGLVMSCGAIVLMIGGIFWMRSVVRIEA